MIRDIGYLKILKSGPGTSIQDGGRIGFAQYGVPLSGAIDVRSFMWANHLLKNKDSDAVLEVCQPGLSIIFNSPTLICLAGAIAAIKFNGEVISSYGILEIRENDQLEIGAFHQGSVLYLGIKDGFQSEKIMDSRSWYAGITTSESVKKGDQVPYFTTQELPENTASKVKWEFNWTEKNAIEVYPGPEWELLDEVSQERIESMEFTISDLKNRMAIQLAELLPNSISEMATAPVFLGTVQLTSGGKLIILMKDAQVTGGYPRILQISQEWHSILAQKKPLQKISFQLQKSY
ncbi:biotin-dependent carboxyltransferase family protein [Algoriphagus sp. D3-2-R+10]|uniref:5-oxoprolinase subunit C family protein n=1 Tax=Algoriphagus aurantiacus TaxID=3103948 RepID=UPI002B3781A4|nr:biotin-dependent carboxyltransferase family protein [Algoriphagus sp. D3-2-R+10]MEB2774108.1 biotin-dependent carboxyltransferase family protein [Algoriphagus sp. D3-2-R+10]